MLTSEQLSTFRMMLLERKGELEEKFRMNDHYGMERGHPHESVGELSSYDNHPGDEGTELYEREKDLALNEHSEKELKDIEKSLDAIKRGTYGKCEVCGKDIPLERLKALPTTSYCVEHSSDQWVSNQRPIEEGVLLPPFGKFEFDEEDVEAYDAEDSWQDVAKWGTSETPSDFMEPIAHYNDAYMESHDRVGYVEDYENFIGTDIEGKEITVYPNKQHERYEQSLDEEGIMTTFGDLPPYEKDPYTEDTED